MISKHVLIYMLALILGSPVYSKVIQMDFHRRYTEFVPGTTEWLMYKTHEVDLINTRYDQMLVQIGLGTPIQKFTLLVDSGSGILWVLSKDCTECRSTPNKFDTMASRTYVNTGDSLTLRYGTGFAQGEVSEEVISLGDIQASNFKFLLVTSEVFDGSDGILGLAYYNNYGDKYSLLDQLKKNGSIEKLMYTQIYTSPGKGQLLIGDYPEEVLKDKDNLGSCLLVAKYRTIKNPYWACQMTGLFFGFNNYNSTLLEYYTDAIWDTGSNHIFFPEDLYEMLGKTYLAKYMRSGECTLQTQQMVFLVWSCRSSAYNSLESMNFVFGKWALYLEKEDLFANDGFGRYQMKIAGNKGSKDLIIGEPLLKKFKSIFNKEEGLFQFYGENKYNVDVPYNPPTNPTDALTVILWVLLSLLILAFVIYIVHGVIKYIRNRDSNTGVRERLARTDF